tara:strand:- start:4582 stop:5193 length:612 start_codon:yes stop_codon:yes gene_type:complete
MDIEIKNVEVYNQIANDFSDKRFSSWNWIDGFLNSFQKNKTILDMGCGNGRNMTKKDLNFIGIDNCHNFINICKRKGLSVMECDMANIPLPEKTFDGIICITSFHHLATIDRRKQTLMEMSRMLKHNGKILLSVWSIDQRHNNKLKFDYGDNYIPWKDNTGMIKGNRYYYIFKNDEIKLLLEKYFIIENHFWDHGNEIFILTH